ncbi:MAG: FadR family transcriptional regulator [Rhodobacteraceae bacterium]|nr:FadR family transcriptional regulator [Paracoccaceae bacterium]
MTSHQRPPWDIDDEIKMPVTASTRRIADKLFSEIVSGVHSYGTRLPSERALTEEYDLSRNTVRQALALLEDYGLTRRRVGSGSVVCYRPDDNEHSDKLSIKPPNNMLNLTELGANTSPLELSVARSILEPEIARLAVLSMTPRDIGKLFAILTEMDNVTVDGERFAELDDELRMQIARGSHNPLLISTYEMINLVSRDAAWSAQRRKSLTPGRIREYRLENRSLCEAIEQRDIESAVEYLKLLLTDFNQDLMRGS